MTKENPKDKVKKRHYFHITMIDLLKACFCGTDKNCIKENDDINFFLYIVEYDKNTDSQYEYSPDRPKLTIALAAEGGRTSTPKIPILLDFLRLHILDINSKTTRSEIYYDRSGNKYTQKTSAELIGYCKDKLGLEFKKQKGITSDFLIDVITICFVAGRHLLFSQVRPLNNLFSLDPETILLSLLREKKSRFTIVHGNINERRSRYMAQYIINQLHDVSYNIDYESYRTGLFLESIITPQWKSKHPDIASQLSQAIFNAYLLQEEEHYLIIHRVPTQKALNDLIGNCRLCKNIILVCDFDMDSSYLAFQDFYRDPLPADIKNYFGEEFMPTDELCNTLLAVSKGNLFILHTLLLLIKNLSDSNNAGWEEDLKKILDTLSLDVDRSALPTEKYSMDIDKNKRTSNNLVGHIRRLYKTILSADEWLLLLLIALHGENGIAEEVLSKILSQSGDDTINSLVNKNLISKKGTSFIYSDSLLIPYALVYGKQSLNKTSSSYFSDIMSFMKFMVDEICYYNSKPINYNILCITLKKTYKAVFILLHKSLDEYTMHFAEIWYYHIRCTNFFLENDDIDSLNELKENFQSLAKNLMKRLGEKNHRWKKLYLIYTDFLELCIQTFNTPPTSWDPHVSLIKKLMEQISKYGSQAIRQDAYIKLLLYLLEMNIYYLLRLCISGLRECYLSCTEGNVIFYRKKLQTIRDMSLKFLKSQNIFDKWILLNDISFLPEMKNAFNTMIQLADLYSDNDNCRESYLIGSIPLTQSFEMPRYIQLSWFQIYCSFLGEQCRSEYTAPLKVADLQCIAIMYQKLDLVPLYILEDYYYALINYTLKTAPFDAEKLCAYLFKDIERYKHIWQHSEILAQMNNTISKIKLSLDHKN